MMDLEFLQNGRVTRRFHGLPMLDYQRVDAHSYGVVQLVRLLCADYNTDAKMRERLLLAALDHDLAEHKTGDIPGPSKRKLDIQVAIGAWEDSLMNAAGLEQPRHLDAQETRILKLADAAEGCLHCIEERRMGNAHPRLLACFYEFWKYCTVEQRLGGENAGPAEMALRIYIAAAWTKANGGVW